MGELIRQDGLAMAFVDVKKLVLDAVESPITRSLYSMALDGLFTRLNDSPVLAADSGRIGPVIPVELVRGSGGNWSTIPVGIGPVF
jgi:hypothetical protein